MYYLYIDIVLKLYVLACYFYSYVMLSSQTSLQQKASPHPHIFRQIKDVVVMFQNGMIFEL